MITLSILIGIIIGIYKLRTIPQPNEPMSKAQLNDYYFNNGWKEYEKQKQIKAELEAYEKEKAENKIYNDLAIIAHLENQKEQLNSIYNMIENELKHEKDPKKQTALYNKLRTIDNQTFMIDQKIHKILD